MVESDVALQQEIAARRRAEEALRRSEECLRLLVEGARDYCIFMIDPEGRVVSWNAGAQRIRGYGADDITGQHVSCFYPPEDVAQGKPERELRTAREQGKTEVQGWRVRKNGSQFWANILITALHDEAGHLRGYSLVTRDLTERKETEELLRSVVNHVIDGIITIDEDGAVQSFNAAAEKLFGYPASEVIGQNVKALMPEPYHSQHDGYLANYARTGQAKIIGIGREVVGRRKDGSTFPMDLAVSAFRLGHRRFFTGIVRDITERKRLEQELPQRVQELADADRHKNEFLAMLAHELRNPLAPIRNALHLVKMPGADDTVVQQARNMMERQVQHLVRLVDDLLDVSRIMRGKIELHKEVIDLATLVQRAVETAQPSIDAHGHELVVSLPSRAIRIEGDMIRLAQVISNLLTNAAKYSDQASRIWLSAERAGDEVVLQVRDSGIGIDGELLAHIFDLFVQGDGSLARSRGGLGIGLTLVKSLVEMHHGSVTAFSKGPGQGSEFTVLLPILSDLQGSHAEQGPHHKQPFAADRKRRVLVVDDNVDAAESAAMLLRLWGHEAHTVHDGLTALDAVQTYRPDIILLDIGLPGMSGYEVVRQLRAQPRFKRLVVAAMTGYGQDADRLRSKEAGFDFHLTKPLDPNILEMFVASPDALSPAST
jgi:PAS domain S-box-containing protein